MCSRLPFSLLLIHHAETGSQHALKAMDKRHTLSCCMQKAAYYHTHTPNCHGAMFELSEIWFLSGLPFQQLFEGAEPSLLMASMASMLHGCHDRAPLN